MTSSNTSKRTQGHPLIYNGRRANPGSHRSSGCCGYGERPASGPIFMNRTIKVYPAFNDFYGMEETIERIVGFFATRLRDWRSESRSCTCSPVGGGKSSLAERLKSLMERQPIYVLKAGQDVSPLFESPLGSVRSRPDGAGSRRQVRYSTPPSDRPDEPLMVKRLDEFNGDSPGSVSSA